jgi:hypothetical protein
MRKPKMSSLEEAFYRRYNRKVVVNATRKENTVSAEIRYRDEVFTIIEALKDGLTDYVEVKYKDKTNRFARYIDAEIFIADTIGEL